MTYTPLTMTSELTGEVHTRRLPVSQARLLEWMSTPEHRRPLVQEAFPDLNEDDREFILTGATPEEWEAEFGDDWDDVLSEDPDEPAL